MARNANIDKTVHALTTVGPKKSNKNKVTNKNDDFNGALIGVGASAGGLEALEKFFDYLSNDLDLPIVVIQHLSPDHKSMMDELLSKHTLMPIKIAENGMKLIPNNVFLIPPAKTMTLHGDTLKLLPKRPHEFTLPIDIFFSSMSETCKDKGIAVILSGTGSDGSKGAIKIKQMGGKVLIQDPKSAKFDGMPNSAISSIQPDSINTPENIALSINDLIKNNTNLNILPNSPIEHDSPLTNIFAKLFEISGIDFTEYKPATVERRVQRRIQLCNLRNYQDYLQFLTVNSGELFTLKREILIPVSSFFRDKKFFEYIKESVIPTIVENCTDNQIRVWVAGCASGEEAYTYSILFNEVFSKLNKWPQLKIFATDVEQENIVFAGTGVYPETIINDVGEERATRFFTRKGSSFVVKNEIRQNIIFARHNLLTDPPFTKTHLISCRNTLIYFQAIAQQKAFQRFHYSLTRGGYLVLGSSESIGNSQQDFLKVNARLKVYQQNKLTDYALNLKSLSLKSQSNKSFQHSKLENSSLNNSNPIIQGQNLLIQNYAPASLLIDRNRRLMHVYGNAQKYLQFSDGKVTLDISKLLIGRLGPSGVALLHKVMKEQCEFSTSVEHKDIHNNIEKLQIVVRPITTEFSSDPHYLMSIQSCQATTIESKSEKNLDIDTATFERIQSLESDLAATRDSLQATIEELETSNEELQATNEELMASNEELQSTNEELQSVNEELYTVNSENQEKIEILNRLNDDLENITKASHIPTIFLDSSLQISRFTNEITSIFRIRPTDIGRSVEDFSHELDYPDFVADIQKVISNDIPTYREIKSWNNRWYLVRILPYKERNINQNTGVVITFVEITSLKDYQRLQAIIDSLPEHIAVLDNKAVIVTVNKSWKKFAESNGDRGLIHTGPGVNYLDVCKVGDSVSDQHSIVTAAQGIREILSGIREYFSMTYPCHSPSEKRWFLMHCSRVEHVNGGLVVSHINVTDWVLGSADNEFNE